MAVTVYAKVDANNLYKALRKNGEKWAKQMEYATKDMKRAAPSIVATQTTQVYAVKKGEVNANAKKFQGSCSLSGGMADLTLEYKGRMLSPVHFGMSTTGDFWRKYTIKATILRGHRVKIGHWQLPGMEGGRHRQNSPAMVLPGVKVPVYRRGYRNGWKGSGGDHKAVKVISVPQMVTSERHINATIKQLQNRQMELLSQRLSKFGIV